MGNTLLEILTNSMPKVESAALIANGKFGGCIVAIRPGCVLRMEVDQLGSSDLADYGLDDAPQGLSIWEGYDRWIPGNWEHPQDGEVYFHGDFRPLTLEELAKLANGEPLWPEPVLHVADCPKTNSDPAKRTDCICEAWGDDEREYPEGCCKYTQ